MIQPQMPPKPPAVNVQAPSSLEQALSDRSRMKVIRLKYGKPEDPRKRGFTTQWEGDNAS